MGLAFGKITVETPKYAVVASGADYEIREYGSNIVAEVSYDPSKDRSGGFMILANFIGALGNPQNVKGDRSGEKIAMTAPVLTTDEAVHSEKISMTAPVLTCQEEGLPEKIEMTAPVLSSQEEGHAEKISMTAPVLTEEKPADGGSGGGKSGMMVMQFVLPSKYKCLDDVPRPTDPRVRVKEVSPRKYGVTTFSGIASEKLVEVKVSELEKSLHEAGYKVTGRHVLAQYNPPWTIPFLRKNEVMVPLE